MRATWKLFVDAHREEGARTLLRRAADAMAVEPKDATIQPYHKGGHVVSFELELGHERWAEAVLHAVELGQRLGSGWCLHGDVRRDVSASLSHTGQGRLRVAGITMATWDLLRGADR